MLCAVTCCAALCVCVCLFCVCVLVTSAVCASDCMRSDCWLPRPHVTFPDAKTLYRAMEAHVVSCVGVLLTV